jgi:putative ABC transport system permease protein
MGSMIAPIARLSGMGTILAVRNLVHDRVRLFVTLVGVVFAVVLIAIQVGLFLGFATTTSSIIDHSGADLWIMAQGTRDVDQTVAISERKLYQSLGVKGVERATRLNVDFANFRRSDGGSESVLVIGFDPLTGLGGPWNVVEGDIRDLNFPDTIMVDELYRQKLGITHLGQVVEIEGHRAQVVGFTRGIRSFTQSPYVFTSTRSSLHYSRLREDQSKYVLINLVKGADRDTVKAALEQNIADIDVHTTAEFSASTQHYWMFTTGAGLALIVAALMGVAVGIVVVSQTLYATTVDHIAEFGTLRAIGASNAYIHGVILRQAVMSAVIGYGIGMLLTLVLIQLIGDNGPAILLPGSVAAGLFVVTVAMCVFAALISIRKITRLDPAAVFK